MLSFSLTFFWNLGILKQIDSVEFFAIKKIFRSSGKNMGLGPASSISVHTDLKENVSQGSQKLRSMERLWWVRGMNPGTVGDFIK